jgi:Zn-dependent protease
MVEERPALRDRHFGAISAPIHTAILSEKFALADPKRPLHNRSKSRRATVYLFEPAHTQLDLNFNLFGIHVRVHPMFWVVTAILGSNQGEARYVLLWVAVAFVSILIHEMGHVLMGRIFGSDGHIVLYGFGGLAIGSSDLNRRWQRNLVYAAGPFAQFLLLGLGIITAFGYLAAKEGQVPKLLVVFSLQFAVVNLFWPIVNLLPVWPLDGGRISRETFEWLLPETGTATSLVVSMIVAGALAINSLLALKGVGILPSLLGDMYLGLFFALFAVSNFQEWQMVRYRSRHSWDNEPDAW